MDKKKVVILFSRLSDYMLNVYKYWVVSSNVELHVMRKSVDKKEAPFEFNDDYKGIYFYNREDLKGKELDIKVKEIDPDMILCSGWSDRGYLKVISSYKGKIPTVLTMDNQWLATPKQKFATLIAPFMLTNKFTHIWVPGESQKKYAKKLGFKKTQIHTGFYVANSQHFLLNTINPTHQMVKQFIFVGRYIEIKGLKELWKAFVELQDEMPNEWELICIGAGELFEKREIHPKIKHLGFIQPYELKEYMAKGGVFILPSHFEPWGVVVHEFALAGFPMIVSDAVGAAIQFVENGKNGFIFKSQDFSSLKIQMKKIMLLSKAQLKQMGNISYLKSKKITQNQWIETANILLNGKVNDN